jgi:chromosome segregation ATPase
MDADPRDQRIRGLEAENASLRAQVRAQAEPMEQLQQLIRRLQDRIEELEPAARREMSRAWSR